VQPVIPFSLNEDWNLISRTIIPLVDQQDFPVAAMNESGLGDTTASLFFSPKALTAGGWIWGRGRSCCCRRLRGRARHRKVGHRADGGGAEADRAVDNRFSWQHIWSVPVTTTGPMSTLPSAAIRQLCHETKTTFGLNTESTYDWESDQWSFR